MAFARARTRTIRLREGVACKSDPMTLVSERIGQFFHDGHRLEFTEYGGGDRWVVLIHGQLMPRRMHQPLAARPGR